MNETCGTSGQVVGHAISAENGSYTSQLVNSSFTSQLTISVTQEIIGSLIECTSDGEHGSSTQMSMSTGI